MSVQEIIDHVRRAIDEVTANDSAFINQSIDEANLDVVIVDKIPYALRWLLENAPEDKLEGDMVSTWTTQEISEYFSITDGVATVILPKDILRVVSARLSSWKQSPVPILEQSEEYLMQGDPYARGTWDRPVTVLVHGWVTDRLVRKAVRKLELYSAKEATDELIIAFVKVPDLSDVDAGDSSSWDDAEVNVPVKLEGAFIYEIAGLVLVAYREQAAKACFELAERYIGQVQ